MEKNELLATLACTGEEKALMANLLDKARMRTRRNIPVSSRFLTEGEQEMAAILLSRAGEEAVFCGGFADAERRMAVFLPDYLETVEESGVEPVMIRCLADRFHEEELSHRDYLGALMALGIERDTVGDIVISGREGYLAVTQAAAEWILSGLISVGRCRVTCEVISPDMAILPTKKVEPFTETVASMRLDCLVAAVFRLSREEAASAIRTGRVQVGGKEASKVDAEVKEGAKLALRGGGKVRVQAIAGMSKKGRIRVVFERYL